MNVSYDKPNLLLGIIITIIAYFCFAIGSSCVKAIGSNFPTFEIVFFQNLTSLICIIPYCMKKNTLNFKFHFMKYHLARDLGGTASYIFYFSAIKYGNLVDATVLTYSAPFFTPIIWSIWSHEKMEKDIWWTIVLGFIGIAFILQPTANIIHSGSSIGILAGIASAFSLVANRKLNLNHASLSRTLFYFFLLGTIITLPLAIITWKGPTGIELILMICVGIATVVGQIFLTIAYRHGTASFLSPLCYSIVVFIVFISWIFFDDAPGILTLIGTGLIVVGGTLTFIIRKKPKTISKLFERPSHPWKKWWEFWKHNNNNDNNNNNHSK